MRRGEGGRLSRIEGTGESSLQKTGRLLYTPKIKLQVSNTENYRVQTHKTRSLRHRKLDGSNTD